MPKHYITPGGARRLRDELDKLWRVTRPEVTRQVSEAAALGDRSENADYIYGKKRLREIDKRIRYLQKRIDDLQVVDRIPDNTDTVYFGAYVRLGKVVLGDDQGNGQSNDQGNGQGNEQTLRIVGSDEFDPKLGWISLNSPMAKSLIGKKEGDSILLRLPAGTTEYEILEVSYAAFEEQG